MRKVFAYIFFASMLGVSFTSLAQSASAVRPAPGADDKVYTWVDKKGIRHYVDGSATAPSEFAKSRSKEVRLMMSSDQRESFSRGGSERSQENRDAPKNESTDKMTSSWERGAAPDEKLAPTRAAACEVARRNVSVLADTSQPAYVRDSSGNPVPLDSAGRALKLDQANRDVASYCSG